MAYTLLAHTYAQSTDAANVTTASIDTTGADLIVVVGVGYAAASTITDSKSNTWSNRTDYSDPANAHARISYVQGGTVGTGHTFSNNSGSYPAIFVAAFSGSQATPYDVENGANSGSATSLQPGSITPTADNELLICGVGITGGTSGTPTISGASFTTLDSVQRTAGGNAAGGGLGYVIQTTATAANPTWSWTNSDVCAACIASFKAAAGGGGRTTKNTRHTELGVDTGQDMWGHL